MISKHFSFQNDENIVVENEEQINNDTELVNTEVVDHPDESLNNEELSKIDIENQEEVKPTNNDLIDEDIRLIIDDLIQKVEESKVRSIND